MDIQEIPIGIVGAGNIAQTHLTAYRNRGFNVVAKGDIYFASIEATGFVPNFPERHIILAMTVHHCVYEVNQSS